MTLIPASEGTPERIATLASGSIHATAVTSPAEYTAEKQGLRTLVSMQDVGKLVRIPNTGTGATQKKIEKDEIVRLLRALRSSILLIQEQPDYGISLFERILRLDRASAEKFYGLFREQYSPIVKDLLAIGTFRSKEKDKGLRQFAIGHLQRRRKDSPEEGAVFRAQIY